MPFSPLTFHYDDDDCKMAAGPSTNKEKLTPFKFSLLVLIVGYYESLRSTKDNDTSKAYEEIFCGLGHFNTLMMFLHLLQGPDLKFEELRSRLQTLLHPTLMAKFDNSISEIQDNEQVAAADFMDNKLGTVFTGSQYDEETIVMWSVAGIFMHRMWLSFSQMMFSQLSFFNSQLKAYVVDGPIVTFCDRLFLPPDTLEPDPSTCEPKRCSVDRLPASFAGSMTESFSSIPESNAHCVPDCPVIQADAGESLMGSVRQKAAFSHKQAEIFISQQANLLLWDENMAFPPRQLQSTILSLLEQHPDISGAHFLSYLNNLRVKEYCTTLHNLHHYFDRNMHVTNMFAGDGADGVKKSVSDVSHGYEALNLATLHFSFGHRKEAETALLEAIRMAQETNDYICLQYASAWLSLLGENKFHTGSQLSQAVERGQELSLPYLTSLGVQALAKHNALIGDKPSRIFDDMTKSCIINCQNSLYKLMLTNAAQQSALWSYYGSRESASMCAQLILCLNTEVKGVFFNGEPICLALCTLARLHADKGHHSASNEILLYASGIFPLHNRHAHLWMACDQSLAVQRAVLRGDAAEAERSAVNLRAINDLEGRLHLAWALREKGDRTASLRLLERLKDECLRDEDKTPDFLCRVLLGMAETFMSTDSHTAAALPFLTDCLIHANTHHLHYLASIATLRLAHVQLHLGLPCEAMQSVEVAMLDLLSHGSVYDQAYLLFTYTQCTFSAATTRPTSAASDRREVIREALSNMNTVVDLLHSVDATKMLKDAVYYQAHLCHQLGLTCERNRFAHRFRKLDQQPRAMYL